MYQSNLHLVMPKPLEKLLRFFRPRHNFSRLFCSKSCFVSFINWLARCPFHKFWSFTIPHKTRTARVTKTWENPHVRREEAEKQKWKQQVMIMKSITHHHTSFSLPHLIFFQSNLPKKSRDSLNSFLDLLGRPHQPHHDTTV